jgi:hypothetical protein
VRPDLHWREEERAHDRRSNFTRVQVRLRDTACALHEGANRSSRHRRHVFIATNVHRALVKDRLIAAADRPAGLCRSTCHAVKSDNPNDQACFRAPFGPMPAFSQAFFVSFPAACERVEASRL